MRGTEEGRRESAGCEGEGGEKGERSSSKETSILTSYSSIAVVRSSLEEGRVGGNIT